MKNLAREIAIGLSVFGLIGATDGQALAQTTLEKVKAQGFVQCGSETRPGLAMVDDKGNWSGLNVEICRAVAVAVFGTQARYAYHRYEAPSDFNAIRDGSDQLAFLSFDEMSEQKLTDKVLPGPAVFVESHDVLVASDSPIQKLADLSGQSACFITGAAANSSLDAWFESRKIPLIRIGFQEDGEMYDAFNVQRCKAMAGEATFLATARLDGGINHLKSRLLPEHLDTFPIVAATSLNADAQWASVVAWTIASLKAADTKETPYRAGGGTMMPVDGTGIGLAKDWQRVVVASVGSYSDIFNRTLGATSRLHLDQGLNTSSIGGNPVIPPLR